MERLERIRTALSGGIPDRLPVSFWRHFPLDDRDAPSLARRMIEFQQNYDLDFIKVMLERHGPLPDWGARVRHYDADPHRLGDMEEPLVRSIEDWERFIPRDVRKGTLARDIDVVRLIAARDASVPVIQTVFSPFTLAFKAAGDLLFTHLRQEPGPVLRALDGIADTLAVFVEGSLQAGAAGIFFAVQAAQHGRLTSEEYGLWSLAYDRRVLEAAQRSTGFNILHLHGPDLLFQELQALPADAVNWEPGAGNPTVAEAAGLTAKGLMAGIHHEKIVTYTPEDAAQAVESTFKATKGRRLVLAPTCTIEPSTDPGILRGIERMAKSYGAEAISGY